MLTHKQKELLTLIQQRMADGGVPPSFEEMKEAVGLKSKSGIHRLITGLEERGFIRRLPNKARALEVLRYPDDLNPAPATIADQIPVPGEDLSLPANDNLSIPVMGRIAAGVPIEAIAHTDRFISMPPDMLGRGDFYALEVEGDSMIEAGINDGDTVIIQRRETVSNGDIAVCLVEREEVTLKYFRQTQDTVTLSPANRAYEPRILPSEQVAVQGRLVHLMRSY